MPLDWIPERTHGGGTAIPPDHLARANAAGPRETLMYRLEVLMKMTSELEVKLQPFLSPRCDNDKAPTCNMAPVSMAPSELSVMVINLTSRVVDLISRLEA